MSIREINRNAENLLEKGENTKREKDYYEGAVIDAQSSLYEAYRELERASQTDDEGNYYGDVGYAEAQIEWARLKLEANQRELNRVKQELIRINLEKKETVKKVEKYNQVGEQNLSKLEQLQSKKFGSNANSYIANLVARMNAGEDVKAQLMQSMGMGGQAKTYTASAVGSSGGTSTSSTLSSNNMPSTPTQLIPILTPSRAYNRQNINRILGVENQLQTAIRGKIDESFKSFNQLNRDEQRVVNQLLDEGYNVILMKETPNEKKSFDFMVNGIPTELKTLNNTNIGTLVTRVKKATEQLENVKNGKIIYDISKANFTPKQITEIKNRLVGKYGEKILEMIILLQ